MKPIILPVLLLLLTSCTAVQQRYAVDSAVVMAQAAVLETQYEELEQVIRSKKATFTEDEWRILEDCNASVMLIGRKYKALTRFTDGATPQDINLMYELAVSAYNDAYMVVSGHWDEYDQVTKAMLKAFEANAVNTSERIEEVIANPENADINETLFLISNILIMTAKIVTAVL